MASAENLTPRLSPPVDVKVHAHVKRADSGDGKAHYLLMTTIAEILQGTTLKCRWSQLKEMHTALAQKSFEPGTNSRARLPLVPKYLKFPKDRSSGFEIGEDEREQSLRDYMKEFNSFAAMLHEEHHFELHGLVDVYKVLMPETEVPLPPDKLGNTIGGQGQLLPELVEEGEPAPEPQPYHPGQDYLSPLARCSSLEYTDGGAGGAERVDVHIASATPPAEAVRPMYSCIAVQQQQPTTRQNSIFLFKRGKSEGDEAAGGIAAALALAGAVTLLTRPTKRCRSGRIGSHWRLPRL